MRPIILFLFPALILAQDLQTRLVFQSTVDLRGNWFVTGLGIGNFRTQTPNNVNLFGGIGYRSKTWWLQGTVQRQWSKPGNNLLLDFRFHKQFAGRRAVSFYTEATPFLTRRAFYEFVIVEARIWSTAKPRWYQRWRAGGETENVHRSNVRDSLAAGVRLTYPIGMFRGWVLSSSLAYRVQSPEPNALRFYFSVNRRFGKK